MRSGAESRFAISNMYYVVAREQIDRGTPVSGILKEAQTLLQERGWCQPSLDDDDVRSTPRTRELELRTAILMAAGEDPQMPLRAMRSYTWFTPVESIVGSSIGKWERQGGLTTNDVLAVLDEAISFAEQAEQSPPQALVAAIHEMEGKGEKPAPS
jgi:hypothetical protein